MRKNLTEIVFILDRSGSMSGLEADTIGGYTQGKNATDSAMIIDAMDLLYTGNLDGFCLVSSDSDFTRLAERLRDQISATYMNVQTRHPYNYPDVQK